MIDKKVEELKLQEWLNAGWLKPLNVARQKLAAVMN